MPLVAAPQRRQGFHASEHMGGGISDDGTPGAHRVGALQPEEECTSEAHVSNPIFQRVDALTGVGLHDAIQ
eukprot:2160348-Alexandrium_andersonii.AAC.1